MNNQIYIPITAQNQTVFLSFSKYNPQPELSHITLAAAPNKNPQLILRADVFKDPLDAFSTWILHVLDDSPQQVVFSVGDHAELVIDLNNTYVQILRDGAEFVYWDFDEFRDAPADVLGALCGALACVSYCSSDDLTLIYGIYTSHWEEGVIETPGSLYAPSFTVDAVVSESGDDYEHHLRDTFTCKLQDKVLVLDVEDDALTFEAAIQLQQVLHGVKEKP